MWSSELEVLFGESDYTLSSTRVVTAARQDNSRCCILLTVPCDKQIHPKSCITCIIEKGILGRIFRQKISLCSLVAQSVLEVEAGPVIMSVEFINYLLALTVLSVRYAAVFWYTNATFSFAFAFMLLVTSVQNAFAYCGMQILYKFAVSAQSFMHFTDLDVPVIFCYILFLGQRTRGAEHRAAYVSRRLGVSLRHILRHHINRTARHLQLRLLPLRAPLPLLPRPALPHLRSLRRQDAARLAWLRAARTRHRHALPLHRPPRTCCLRLR